MDTTHMLRKCFFFTPMTGSCHRIGPRLIAQLSEGSFSKYENHSEQKQNKQCKNSPSRGSVRVRTQLRGLLQCRSDIGAAGFMHIATKAPTGTEDA